MFRQTRTFYHRKFNELKAKSLQGDFSSTIELHQLCMKPNAGISLSDVIPVLVHHLSDEALASARTFTDARMDSPPVLNAIASLKMLRYFLDKDLNPSRDILLSESFASSIFSSLTEWLYHLVEGMGILSVDFTGLSAHYEDLIKSIAFLIRALVEYPSLYDRILVAPGFVPFFLNCWIRVSGAGRYTSQDACTTILMSIFNKETPSFMSSGHSVLLRAFREKPVEVAKASVQGVVSLMNAPLPQDLDREISGVVSMMGLAKMCSPPCVRALLAHNALTWLCRLAHHVKKSVSDRAAYASSLSRVLGEFDALLLHAHANNVAPILQANVLEIVLCVEPMSRNDGNPQVYPSKPGSSDDLQKMLLNIIATLNGFVMYRSLLHLFRKTVRRIERESLADGSSPVLDAYRDLVKEVRTRSEWMKTHDVSSTRCPCVNPNCLCKTGSRRCTKDDLQRCLGCSFAIYCSYACQKEHWSRGGHKIHCSRLDAARLNGSQLLPVSPRDAAAFYATVEEDMTRQSCKIVGNDEALNLARVFQGLDEGVPPTTVLNLEFGQLAPDHPLPMSASSLKSTTLEKLVKRVVERNGAVYDKAHFEGCVKRLDGGLSVVLTLANGILVDLTNASRIRKGIYPVEIYGDVNAC
ncbi:hypothetical protein BDZ89DRAFT_42214 [Hymenopellis radicata]|nr:hypothetical protein BDZ89DRAFT_42214 [Hymenopellis radicata]